MKQLYKKNNVEKQKGTALLTALLIVALVSTTVMTMVLYQRINIRHTSLITTAEQSKQYALGLETSTIGYFIDYLKDKYDTEKNRGTPLMALPFALPATAIPGGSVNVIVLDAQAMYNVNNLQDTKNRVGFIKMLQAIDPKLEQQKAIQITESISAWIKDQQNTTTNDAETYANAIYPYRAPHFPMVSISELRLVAGVDAKLYNKLYPYLTALPQGKTPINVNSAQFPVIMSLGDKMTEDLAHGIIADRNDQNTFQSIREFLKVPSVQAAVINENAVTIASEYYIVSTTVNLGKQRYTMYSLLQISKSKGKMLANILWRSRGTM